MIDSISQDVIAAVAAVAEWVARAIPLECMEPMFMKRALLGLLLLGALSACAGIQVVNSRMSFFSDAIGHSAFAGVALGVIFGLAPTLTMPLFAVLVGVFIMYIRRGSKLSSDTVIGVIFSAVVAFGLAVVSRARGAVRDMQMFLYGDILTIDEPEILVLTALFLLFVLFQFFAYNRMLSICVNPQLAAVHRIRVPVYQYLFSALLALIVIFSVRAVGVFLATALLVVPAATARNFSQNSRGMFWQSMLCSEISVVVGLLISAQPWANTPSGATIVLVSSLLFGISFLFSRLFMNGRTSDMDK